MASGIMENDMSFVVGEPAWHGLGKNIKEAVSSEEAIRIANLDWDVLQVPLYAGTKEVPGYYGNIRSDTKDFLGMVTAKYKITQNTEAFSFVDDIMAQKDIPCTYESAGSLFNGKRVYLLAKMPNREILGDQIENYLFFSNSFNGKSSIKVGLTCTRICCNNTLQLAIKEANRVWSFRHMGNLEEKKREAMITLGLATSYLDAMALEAERLAKIKVNAQKFVEELFPLDENEAERAKKNILTSREEVLNIFTKKEDLQNFRKDGWGAYNAVADFVSNVAPLRMTKTYKERRFVSFLDGNDLMERAQLILTA